MTCAMRCAPTRSESDGGGPRARRSAGPRSPGRGDDRVHGRRQVDRRQGRGAGARNSRARRRSSDRRPARQADRRGVRRPTARRRSGRPRSASRSSCSTTPGRASWRSAAARSARRAVREALARHLVVWIDVDVDTAWARCRGSGRPLAADRAPFERLHAEREPLYDALADLVVPHERSHRMSRCAERRRRPARRNADAVGDDRGQGLPGLHRSGAARRARVLAADRRRAALPGHRRRRRAAVRARRRARAARRPRRDHARASSQRRSLTPRSSGPSSRAAG